MKVHLKYIYYYKFETKIIADNEQKTRKIGRVKVHSHDGQWEGNCNVYAHSSLWMRLTGDWLINAKMVYSSYFYCLMYV